MRTVSNDERRWRLATRHRLATPAEDVVEAADSMTCLHSSDPVTVFLSARARVQGFKQGDLEHALYEEKSLARIHAMRRTLFVVPVEMVSMLHNSSTVALIGPERKRLAGMLESSGIAKDGARWIETVSKKTVGALRRRGEAVAVELSKEVPELNEKITFYKADGSVQNTVGMTTRILFLLATEGKVIRVRPKGTWVSGMYRWAPMDEWLGGPIPEVSKPEAQVGVLRKWLTTFGPGTEIDMKWWTGWPVTQVRAALATIGAVEVDLEPGTGYLLPDDLDRVPPVEPWVALLPSLDPTTMGWKEREWYLGPHAPRLFDSNGNAGQTIWVDGKTVGAWGQRVSGEVVWELLEDVGRESLAEVERQAAEVETWLSGKRVIARFASPLDRELSAR
ncbi:MAG TPA: winged helix DNA-binding domain-containing protein [Acidimicrobiia bacterium]|nr:winged helix DNA-binding domain-containing protein [Acidimicrobiia bacterium]